MKNAKNNKTGITYDAPYKAPPADVLIISSDYTGHGHKSISEALTEQFEEHYPSMNIVVIDGFSLAGSIGTGISKLYGTVTRTSKDLWKLIWEISSNKPSLFIDFCEAAIEDDFISLVKKLKPRVILSVHPYFNAPVLNLLRRYGLRIPFVTLVADLVSITSLWADSRADYIICPTQEAAARCAEYGIDKDRLRIFGFPVRKRFIIYNSNNNNSNDSSCVNNSGNNGNNGNLVPSHIKFLMMSGGEGVANINRISRFLKTLLTEYNCSITIVAGRNKVLKRSLELALGEKFEDRVRIIGFTKNIHELMIESDIIFARGSPNVAMEAVYCNKPIIITGALPGQEAENPIYLSKHGLGLICNGHKTIKPLIDALLRNNGALYDKIREAQRNYMQPDSAHKITSFIAELALS